MRFIGSNDWSATRDFDRTRNLCENRHRSRRFVIAVRDPVAGIRSVRPGRTREIGRFDRIGREKSHIDVRTLVINLEVTDSASRQYRIAFEPKRAHVVSLFNGPIAHIVLGDQSLINVTESFHARTTFNLFRPHIHRAILEVSAAACPNESPSNYYNVIYDSHMLRVTVGVRPHRSFLTHDRWVLSNTSSRLPFNFKQKTEHNIFSKLFAENRKH